MRIGLVTFLLGDDSTLEAAALLRIILILNRLANLCRIYVHPLRTWEPLELASPLFSICVIVSFASSSYEYTEGSVQSPHLRILHRETFTSLSLCDHLE